VEIFMGGLLGDRFTQMWADGQFEHGVDIRTPYSLQHKPEAQDDMGSDKGPIDDVGNHMQWFHADD
jgi:hypothetical protein